MQPSSDKVINYSSSTIIPNITSQGTDCANTHSPVQPVQTEIEGRNIMITYNINEGSSPPVNEGTLEQGRQGGGANGA